MHKLRKFVHQQTKIILDSHDIRYQPVIAHIMFKCGILWEL